MPTLYGQTWPDHVSPLSIEFQFIKNGGYWNIGGKQVGKGLFHHFRAAQTLLWPETEHNPWSDLILQNILENRITSVSGCRDSGKTFSMSRYSLTDYFIFPNDTLIIMTSTDLRGLQLRVWGEIKRLFLEARARWPGLPGNVVESLHGVFTDQLTDDTPIRDIRKGIIGIPILDRKGAWTGGLSKFVGIKQKRRRLLGDEVQFAPVEYLTVLSNLDKGDFKGVFVGNALANMKALDKISEPLEGWANHPDPVKTEVFPNRFGGKTITLVGTDSPNFDYPEDQPTKFPYLIDWKDEKSVRERYGKDSEQYYSQILGIRKPGLFAHRVLTPEMCEKYGAFEKCVWEGESTTKVYACDMGFGGDRCVAGWGEFGQSVDGRIVLRFNQPKVIPISVDSEPEDQIALFIREDCREAGIEASHVFFEAGMKATAATAMAKIFSPECNAVNFGGSPTKRPVSADEFVIDRETGNKRPKRCDEHYIKFVTELYFSIRLATMARQIRELPKDVADEFYMREWTKEKGDRYEIETKKETKERTGMSPDLADWGVIVCEGARRLGFMIENLPDIPGQTSANDDYLQKEIDRFRRSIKSRSLSYT